MRLVGAGRAARRSPRRPASWSSRSPAATTSSRIGPGAERAILVAPSVARGGPPAPGPCHEPRTIAAADARSGRGLVHSRSMAANNQIRLLVVEDVPQVAQYIRGLLNSQAAIKLLDVVTRRVARSPGQVEQLRPDVVLVDALLQGRIKGLDARRASSTQSGAGVPVIVLTVPQQPVEVDPAKGIHGVLSMPFSGYDLINRVARRPPGRSRRPTRRPARRGCISVFAPKGGVGKTTIAFNLAVAIGQLGQRTVLIDGSLQFGDLRALLKVPVDAPSILDLPTDRIQESDLQDVLWRDPSGHRHPPRPAAGRDGRDGHRPRRRQDAVAPAPRLRGDRPRHAGRRSTTSTSPSSTRRTRSSRSSPTTPPRSTTRSPWRTRSGRSAIRRRRSATSSTAPTRPAASTPTTSRGPSAACRSTRSCRTAGSSSQSNNEGVPFVLADPAAAISQDIMRLAAELVESRAPRRSGGR